jgi:hypothetical protein
MADKPFDRRVYRQRERPLSTDLNEQASWADYSVREVVRAFQDYRLGTPVGGVDLPDVQGTTSGFIGTGFRVRASTPAAFEVVVTRGLGFIRDAADVPTDIGSGDVVPMTGVDDEHVYKPVYLHTDQTITAIPAADPAQPRIDLVEVQIGRRQLDSANREILNAATGVFGSSAVNKTLAFDVGTVADGDFSINGVRNVNYKTGTPGANPVAPAVTAGYTRLAHVHIEALGVTIVDNSGVAPYNQIKDLRLPLLPNHGAMSFGARASVPNVGATGGAVTTTAEHGLPPGWKLCWDWETNAGPLYGQAVPGFMVWLIGPALDSFQASAHFGLEGANASAQPTIGYVDNITSGTLTALEAARLATHADVYPNLIAAGAVGAAHTGQTYIRFNCIGYMFVTPIMDSATSFPNPHDVWLNVNLWRNS